jgi:hypothetical protein
MTGNPVPSRIYLDEAAQRLGVTPLSLRAHWRRWGVRTHKTGGRLWWTAADLTAWLESRAA